ncbi:hypothetical protein TrST_g13412 [Triparma strigata]|uniref:C2 domain-containing protein n=1 Tax=Triparma strigata TaxID=1606541 RepID=A0A9W7F098_9STRA|nr:hypothetical protein TrST_g13412 [Triparma strigata]
MSSDRIEQLTRQDSRVLEGIGITINHGNEKSPSGKTCANTCCPSMPGYLGLKKGESNQTSHAFTRSADSRVLVLCGDFALGEIRKVDGEWMPVVGRPKEDLSEKFVSHIKADGRSSDGKTNLTLTIDRYPRVRAKSAGAGGGDEERDTNLDDLEAGRSFSFSSSPPRGTVGKLRHVNVVRHIQCYPDGVLLCPSELDLSEMLTGYSNYVLPHSDLAKQFSKCYYVNQSVYDKFSRTTSGATFDGIEEGDFSYSSINKSTKIRMQMSQDEDFDKSRETGNEEIEVAWESLNDNLGSIRVQLNMAMVDHSEVDHSMTENETSYYLQCRICEGKDLKPMDFNGFSDPYVIAYIVDDEGNKIEALGTYRTHTVYKSLNPIWNFDVDVGEDSRIRIDDYTLVFEVWDADRWSADDQIGQVKVPLWNIPHRWGHQSPLDLWMPLHPGKKWMKHEIENALRTVTETERVKKLTNYTQRMTIATIDNALTKLGRAWRNNVTNDYYMPSGVASSIGAFVERIWFELQLQIMQLIKGVLHVHTLDKYEDAALHNEIVCCTCTNRLVAWYRYHMMPFDKTFWGKIQDPVFVCFLVLNLVPYLGIQTVLFIIKLLAMERRDDYQCIDFIDSFKGLQFVQSLIFVVRGVIQYLECAGLESNSEHTCNKDGPGIINENNLICTSFGGQFCYYMSMGEFLVKVILIYVAFFLLSRSVSLGGKIFVDHRLEGAEIMLLKRAKPNSSDDTNNNNHHKRRFFGMKPKRVIRTKATIVKYDQKSGLHSLIYEAEKCHCVKVGQTRFPIHYKNLDATEFKMLKLPGVPNNVMNFLFWWDVCVFVFVFGVGIMTVVLWAEEEWMTFGIIYWCKVFYQLFSLPFLVLKIPGLKVLLTHAKNTGYKPNGTLVLHKKRKRNS